MSNRPKSGPPALWERLSQYLPASLLILALLLIWQTATVIWQIQEWLLPSPTQIGKAAIEARGLLGPQVWQTAKETLLGFALALGTGTLLALIIDFSATLRRAIYPLLVVSQTIPIIAIVLAIAAIIIAFTRKSKAKK